MQSCPQISVEVITSLLLKKKNPTLVVLAAHWICPCRNRERILQQTREVRAACRGQAWPANLPVHTVKVLQWRGTSGWATVSFLTHTVGFTCSFLAVGRCLVRNRTVSAHVMQSFLEVNRVRNAVFWGLRSAPLRFSPPAPCCFPDHTAMAKLGKSVWPQFCPQNTDSSKQKPSRFSNTL